MLTDIERSVIFKEENECDRETVTADKARVLQGDWTETKLRR